MTRAVAGRSPTRAGHAARGVTGPARLHRRRGADHGRQRRRARSSSAPRPPARLTRALPAAGRQLRDLRPRQHDRPGRQLPAATSSTTTRASRTCATRRPPARRAHPVRQGPARVASSSATTSPTRGPAGACPALFLGADEGKRLTDAMAAGRARPRESPCGSRRRKVTHPEPDRHAARPVPAEARRSRATPTAPTPPRTTARSRWSPWRATSPRCRSTCRPAHARSSRSAPGTSTSGSPSTTLRHGGVRRARPPRSTRTTTRASSPPSSCSSTSARSSTTASRERDGRPGRRARAHRAARDPVRRHHAKPRAGRRGR